MFTSFYWHEFLALALIHFLAVIAPGPDFAITIRQSVIHGRKAGILTAIGIGAGISVHVIYTLIGIGALLHTTPWLMNIVKVMGGLYLIWLGINFLRAKANTTNELQFDRQEHSPVSNKKAFLVGFITNATNPKATIFFLAIFTTVVSQTTPLSIQIFYGIWMCLVNALWFIVVSILFSHSSIRQKFVASGYWFERAMGVVLILFAIRLFLTSF
ncbi:LysE family translocator [Acinetobacter sp.]|uniref:LysE family translocator n=1 Tax=Acinetobacter sp. TaxID=472 RepID=UPI0031DEB841